MQNNSKIGQMSREEKLKGELLKVAELSEEQKKHMLGLLNLYFDNVNEEVFYRDLQEKEWVIILKDSVTGEIKGFSTLTLLDEFIDGVYIKAIFSGDTIIDKNYLGTMELPRVWGRFALSLIKKYKGTKLFWFYISKGYMTYMLMPRYFYEFFPRYDKEIPEFEKKVLDSLATKKFGVQYNSKTGILNIKFNYYLKKGVADITADLLKNPHINFFVKQNPKYMEGEELACITELTEDNMRPIFRQLINENQSRV